MSENNVFSRLLSHKNVHITFAVSLRISARINAAPTGRALLKFNFGVFSKILSRKYKPG